MDHHFKILAWMEGKWPSYTMKKPFAVDIGSRRGFAVAFEVGTLRILLGVLRGKKGGPSGEFIVVDTAQQVEVDKLLCFCPETFHGAFTNGIRGHYSDFDQYCPELLIEMMEKFIQNPERIRTLAAEIGFDEPSVVTISGGIPSLGKRK